MNKSWHFTIPETLLQPTVDRLAGQKKISTLTLHNTQSLLVLFRAFSAFSYLPLGLNPEQRNHLKSELQRMKADPNGTISELAQLVKQIKYLKERYHRRKAFAEKLKLPIFSTYDSHDVSTLAEKILDPIENYLNNAQKELSKSKLPRQARHPLNVFKKFLEDSEKKLIHHQKALAKTMIARLQMADEHQDITYDDELPTTTEDGASKNLKPKDFILFHAYIEQHGDVKSRSDLYRLSWIKSCITPLESIIQPKKVRRWPRWLFRGNDIRFKAFSDPHHQVFLFLTKKRLMTETRFESLKTLEQIYLNEAQRLQNLKKQLYRLFHQKTIKHLSNQIAILHQHQLTTKRKYQQIQQEKLSHFLAVSQQIEKKPPPYFFDSHKQHLPKSQQDAIELIKQFISRGLFTHENPSLEEIILRLTPLIPDPQDYLRYLVTEHLIPQLHSSQQPEYQLFLAFEAKFGKASNRQAILKNLERYNSAISQRYFLELLTRNQDTIMIDGAKYLTDISTQHKMRQSLKNTDSLQPLLIQAIQSSNPKYYLKINRLIQTLGDNAVKILWQKHIEEKQFHQLMGQTFKRSQDKTTEDSNWLIIPIKTATIDRVKPFVQHIPTDSWTAEQHQLCESIQSPEFVEQYHLQLLSKILTNPQVAEQHIHQLIDIDYYSYFGFANLNELDIIYSKTIAMMLSQASINNPKAADLIIQQFTTHQLTEIEFPHLNDALEQLTKKRIEEKDADSMAALIKSDIITDQMAAAVSRLDHLQQSIDEPRYQKIFGQVIDSLTQLFIECCRYNQTTLLARIKQLNQSIYEHRLSKNFKQLISQRLSLPRTNEIISITTAVPPPAETLQTIKTKLHALIHSEIATEHYFERFHQLHSLAKTLPPSEKYAHIKRLCASGAHIKQTIIELPNAILAFAGDEIKTIASINPLLLDIIDADLIPQQEKMRLIQLINAIVLDPENHHPTPNLEQQRLVALRNCLSLRCNGQDRLAFSETLSDNPFRLSQPSHISFSNPQGPTHADYIPHL